MNPALPLSLNRPAPQGKWHALLRVAALGTAALMGVTVLSTVMEKASDASILRTLAPRFPAVATFTIHQHAIPWSTLLANNFRFWGSWALLTPVIVLFARRVIVRNILLRVVLWGVFALLACFAHSALTHLGGADRTEPVLNAGQLILRLAGSIELNLVTFGLITGAVYAVIYYRDARARREQQAQLEAQLIRAQLDNLRMQLHPHFFFNTLHTVSSLMSTDVASARRVLVSLGELLRSTMEQSGRQQIPLRDELGLAQRYVEIQQARFGKRLIVNNSVPDALLIAAVPSSLLQPLIENAIRHGIEPYAGAGLVSILAERRENRLHIEVRNDVLHQGVRATPVPSTGMGLANIRARLDHLYPQDYTFEQHGSSNSYTVTLNIPWRLA